MADRVAGIFLRNRISAVRRAEFHGPNDSAVVGAGNRFEECLVNSVFGTTVDRP